MIPPVPGEWVELAACAQTDPELFFPIQGGSAVGAKKVCAGCEVRQECLVYALSSPVFIAGIWGGKTEKERRQMMRGVKRLKPIRHGTEAGAKAHSRRQEPPCAACREAATRRHRQRVMARVADQGLAGKPRPRPHPTEPGAGMSGLGASPAPVCWCGHLLADHEDTPWASDCGECACARFELDADR